MATSARANSTPMSTAVLARATRAAVRNERFDAGATAAALWCVARLARRRDQEDFSTEEAADELARWVSKAAARVDADAHVLSPAERAAAMLAVESLGRGSRERSGRSTLGATEGLTVDEDGRLRFEEEDGGEHE